MSAGVSGCQRVSVVVSGCQWLSAGVSVYKRLSAGVSDGFQPELYSDVQIKSSFFGGNTYRVRKQKLNIFQEPLST